MVHQFEKERGILLFVTLAIAVFIFYMSSRTFPGGGGTGYLSYVYHFGVFFTLAFFLLPATLQGSFNKKIVFLVLSICVVYAALDELHQYFVPGRYPSTSDVLMDSAGILAAAVIYLTSV